MRLIAAVLAAVVVLSGCEAGPGYTSDNPIHATCVNR